MNQVINFIDLGSSLGEELEYMIRNKPKGVSLNLFGVEPDPNNFTKCCEMIQSFPANYDIQTTILPWAIAPSTESIDFYPWSNGHSSTIYKDKIDKSHDQSRRGSYPSVKVHGITFSELLKHIKLDKLPGINVLKMNIEGAELEVFRSLTKHNPFDIIFIDSPNGTRDMAKVPSIFKYIKEVKQIIQSNNFNLKVYARRSLNFYDYINIQKHD